MIRREDTSDAHDQRWADHWPMAIQAGIDEENATIYRAHFDRNHQLADTYEGRAQILDRGLTLQKKWWCRRGPQGPEHPDFQLEERGELAGPGAVADRRLADRRFSSPAITLPHEPVGRVASGWLLPGNPIVVPPCLRVKIRRALPLAAHSDTPSPSAEAMRARNATGGGRFRGPCAP